MQKGLIYIISSLILIYLGYQVYLLQKERISLAGEHREVSSSYAELVRDNERLKEEIDYFSDPHNLEKELRSKFNYKYPYEKLIIIVPEEESSAGNGE